VRTPGFCNSVNRLLRLAPLVARRAGLIGRAKLDALIPADTDQVQEGARVATSRESVSGITPPDGPWVSVEHTLRNISAQSGSRRRQFLRVQPVDSEARYYGLTRSLRRQPAAEPLRDLRSGDSAARLSRDEGPKRRVVAHYEPATPCVDAGTRLTVSRESTCDGHDVAVEPLAE
jgi:hypothetical protein